MYKPLFNQRKALRFRQFTRKRWALFACVGRVVTIGVLSVATLRSAARRTDHGQGGDTRRRRGHGVARTACIGASRENGHRTEPRRDSSGASTKY